MTYIDKLSRLLLAPPAAGMRALLYCIVLIAIPTAIRLLLGLVIDRLPFFPYIPFVIVGAIVLNWKYAAANALGSWIVADLLFLEPRYEINFSAYALIGLTIFIVSAALIIALAAAVRVVVENSLRPTHPDEFTTPVVFSREGGQAWASWYGSHSWVRLGPEDAVADMMRDYLAQIELGRRLDRRSAENPRANS